MVQKPMKLIGVATVLLVVGAAGGLWFSGVLSSVQHGAALPVPPEPPRLSQAPEYARCLDLLPADPIGALSFARDWLMQGGGEGAAQCEALAQLSLGEADAAAEALERIAARSEAGLAARAVVFGQAAEAWRAAGKPQRAAAAATLALALTPQDPDLLLERAMARLTLGQVAVALADLDLAVVLDADRAEAWIWRAAAQRRMENLRPAEDSITTALRLAPRNAEALLERGILRQLRGEAEAARRDWERVLELAPDSAAADLAAQNLALIGAGPSQR
jgi:tetratricopeptide (TPR) repeat protein